MYQCEECSKSFEKWQQKANHVRWNHKKETYTEGGKKLQQEKAILSAVKRFGSWVNEEVNCQKCYKPFKRRRRNSDKGLKAASKFCSKSCSNCRVQTESTKEKIRNKLTHKDIQMTCQGCRTKKMIRPARRNQKFCSISCASKYRYGPRDIENNKGDYRRAASFKFSLNEYPDKFNFDLIKEHGWYSPSNSKKPNLDGVARDHMVSIQCGFENNIDPTTISHPANCKLLLQSENFKKKSDCSITLEELLDRINKW